MRFCVIAIRWIAAFIRRFPPLFSLTRWLLPDAAGIGARGAL